MRALFADTSFYVALVSPTDSAHAEAVELALQFDVDSRRLVTTQFVLIEVANFLCAPARRQEFVNLLSSIRRDRRTRLIPASQRLVDEAVSLFRDRPDKSWSLTDCTSFAVMRRLKLSEALTGDRHFEQAGFRAIMRT
jgi:hypothetical protein